MLGMLTASLQSRSKEACMKTLHYEILLTTSLTLQKAFLHREWAQILYL